MSDLRASIVEENSRTSQSSAYTLRTLPKLASMLQGLREHELSLFSGPTGAGKTTLLSQISLDYALQDVPTLWCSFEIRNSRLGLVMLEQLAQKPLHGSLSNLQSNPDFNWAVEQLSKCPLYFLDCFGKYEPTDFLQSLESSVQTQNVKHIIIDNLQFMLNNSWRGSLDKFDVFDRTISMLRGLCNSLPVHVSLIVHPRKEDDNVPLGLSSISGTAKATQEADNVVILQKLDNKTYVDVKKNRYTGLIGRIPVDFDYNSKSIFELTSSGQQPKPSEPQAEDTSK